MISAATLLMLVQGAQALLTEVPQVEAVAIQVKDFFAGLFKQGLISADTQNGVHAHVDQICEALLDGNVPPEFTVEPDPS